MKTRNLFLSLFAFAALCACNKEAQPDTPVGLENDAYVMVSIVAPSSISTRGDSGTTDEFYDEGEGAENTVSNATFIFFKADGTYDQIATPSLSFKDNVTGPNPFIEKVSEATVILKAPADPGMAAKYMLVVLNAPTGFAAAVEGKSLSEVKDLADDYSEGFVMTNSVYANTGVEASDISGNIKNSAAEALANPVTVYVERILAKVTVTDTGWKLKDDTDAEVTELYLPLDAVADTDGNGLYDNGVTKTVKPVIVGYGLTNTAKTSYLYKNVSGWNIDESWVFDDDNKRSYWATSHATDYNTYVYNDFVQVTIKPDGTTEGDLKKSFYCMENTTSEKLHKTSLIVDVQFVDATTNEPIETFYKCETDYYTEAGLKAVAVQMLKGAGLTTYTTTDIEIVANAKQSSVKVKTTDDNVTAASALSTMANVKKWDGGKAYYYTNIEHFGTDMATPANKLVGVVRNHVYQLTIQSIKGFGAPIGGGAEEVVPDTPEDEEYQNLAATIKILQWKVVNQNVNLQ